jgi:hypothetical protein
VWPPASEDNTRDAVPMPPLKSKHCIPTPEPTHPSSTGPSVAASSAANTSSSVSGRSRTADNHESSHSVTQGITDSAASVSFEAIHATAASYALPICCELVSTMGLSRIPHSAMELMPISSP